MLGSNLNVNSGDLANKLDLSMIEARSLIQQPDTDAGSHNATERNKVPSYVCKHCQEEQCVDIFERLGSRRGSWGMGRIGRGSPAYMYPLCGLNTLLYRCVCVCCYEGI